LRACCHPHTHLDQVISGNDLQVAGHRLLRRPVLLHPHAVALPVPRLHAAAHRKLEAAAQRWRAALACCCGLAGGRLLLLLLLLLLLDLLLQVTLLVVVVLLHELLLLRCRRKGILLSVLQCTACVCENARATARCCGCLHDGCRCVAMLMDTPRTLGAHLRRRLHRLPRQRPPLPPRAAGASCCWW
jgi:hypothetical protein